MSLECTAKLSICVLVVAIYAGECLVYNLYCSPSLRWALLFNCALALALWSYLATAWTDPGTAASQDWQAWSKLRAEEQGAVKDSKLRGWAPGRASYCRHCRRGRPERAHHCAQCGRCVLRMDHHCPWLGGCVGWRNHKYFLLMNWWSFWACVAFLLTLRRPNAMVSVSMLSESGLALRMPAFLGVVTAFLFLLITGGMFWSSFLMAARNLTAVEELFSGENPYRLSCLDNLRQLLGHLDLWLLLPLPPAGRPSGTTFPLARGSDWAAEEGAGASEVSTSSSKTSLASSTRKYGSV